MQLQINTNGAWRTVMAGLGQHDTQTLQRAKAAAAELAALHSATARKPHSWRLVSEANNQVVEHCSGENGWQQSYWPPAEA